MKNLIVIVLALLLAAVLVLGNLHWNSRSSEHTSTPAISISENSTVAEPEIDKEYYLEFAAKWPEKANQQLENKLHSNEKFKIVLLGSNSIGSDSLSLKNYLKEALSEKYEKHVELESIVYDNTTTDYVLNSENDKLVALKPDMIIFEPFLLTIIMSLQYLTLYQIFPPLLRKRQWLCLMLRLSCNRQIKYMMQIYILCKLLHCRNTQMNKILHF